MVEEFKKIILQKTETYQEQIRGIYKKLILDLHDFGGSFGFDKESQIPINLPADTNISSYLNFEPSEVKGYWEDLTRFGVVTISNSSYPSEYRVSLTLKGRKIAEELSGELLETLIKKKGLCFYKLDNDSAELK